MRFPNRRSIFALCLVVTACKTGVAEDPPEFCLQWGSNGAGEGQFAGSYGIEGQ